VTDRIPLDHLTSDQYDALYERLDQAEAERDELRDEIATAGAKLADMAKSRNEWQWRAGDAERRVRVQRERADRAEAAVDRVRAECDQLHRASVLADDQPHTDRERGIVQAITRIHAALDEPAPATPAATQATEARD
jgi:chromosome segregation ATPase